MKKRNVLFITALAVLMASCSDKQQETEMVETDNSAAVIINSPIGAIKGEIMVKFKSGSASVVEQAQLKSIQTGTSHSGNMAIDAVLNRIGSKGLDRIFPIDACHEDRTREAGLHRWYVLQFDPNCDLASVADDLAKLGEIDKIQYCQPIQRAYDPGVRATSVDGTTRGMVQRLQRSDASQLYYDDPDLGRQWGHINNGRLLANGIINEKGEEIVQAMQGLDVGCGEAWKLCSGDPSIIVAVLDEGVMFNHPDLAANMWINEGESLGSREDADGNGYSGDLHGYNFVTDRGMITYNDGYDTGHGTHVAGIIAAVSNNAKGIAGVAGGNGTPNSGVKIMSCQVFAGSGGVSMYQEAKAIKYAADNGAVVLQCSWGYNSGLPNPLNYTPGFISDDEWVSGAPLEKEALDYFIHNAGSPNGTIDGGIVVFAGGNESSAMAGYPGAYPDYISVAAVSADGTPSSFSNYGHGIRVSAPGGDADYHKCTEAKIYSTIPPFDGQYYGYMEGTSMACPYVSGVVALGLSYASQLQKHFRAADFRQLILNSAAQTPSDSYFKDIKVYYSNYAEFGSTAPMQMLPGSYSGKMGYGIVNAFHLMKAIDGAGVELKAPNMFVAINETSSINYERFFAGGKDLTFTCMVANPSIAEMSSNDQKKFVLKGLKEGSTSATVTASNGMKQVFHITVRKGNGWL